MSEEKHKCAEQVSNGMRFSGYSPCSRRGVVNEDGKWWCRQHAPSAAEARHKASMARFVAESLARQKERDAAELVRRKAAAFDAISVIPFGSEDYAAAVQSVVLDFVP